ncbi:hypothetical protein R1flu_007740 [Riccia fluitans]|uniref:Uncharacterized protein n=1 Tax=Riccia fluitans TaxID=41844 RepID=A0ABD1Z088_9MARC
MGLFDWVKGPSPSVPKRCSSAYSACWAPDGSSDEEDSYPEPPESPTSPIFRELGRQRSRQYFQEDESEPDPSSYLQPRNPQTQDDSRRQAKSETQNLPLVLPPPPTSKHPSFYRQLNENSEDRKPSPRRNVREDGRSSPRQSVGEDRKTTEVRSPSPPRQLVEDRRASPRNKVTESGLVSVPRQLYEDRKPSPRPQFVKTHSYLKKYRHPSPTERTAHQEQSKALRSILSSRPRSAPPRLVPYRNHSSAQGVVIQDQPTTPKRLKHRRLSPCCPFNARDSHDEVGQSLPLIPYPGSESSQNAIPLILPVRTKKSRHLRAHSTRHPPPKLCHHHESRPHMGRRGQRRHEEAQRATHDYEGQYYDKDSGGRESLAIEIQREAAQDLAVQEAEEEKGRMMPRSPRSPRSVTESCVDSYCTHSEHPLRQKTWESKFPYSTPRNRPISPPGWTYAPRRKTKRGKWWDKDWPQNKRYLFYDPSQQPCGCPWTKRHAGSRSPSPPVSTRARGIAYADQIVKINRAKSLSPRPKSRRKLVPRESEERAQGTHQHRHVHLQWSCSNSSRNSSRSPAPSSRARSPVSTRVVISNTPTSYGSESPKFGQRRAPRKDPQYEDLVETEAELHPYPNNGVGYNVPLSQSTIPGSLQEPRKSVSKGRTSPSRDQSRRRVVRTGVSAPLRQRPGNSENLQICLSSSSGGSTPCSISVQRNFFYDDQINDDQLLDEAEGRTKYQGRRPREKYVGTMGHCHTPGSWSCTPESTGYPTTPRKAQGGSTTPTTPRAVTPGRPILTRKPEYRVTITCPREENLIDDPADLTESEESCNCPDHCSCRHSCVDQSCCGDELNPDNLRRAIGGPCNWNQVVHHHRHHCFCGSCCH